MLALFQLLEYSKYLNRKTLALPLGHGITPRHVIAAPNPIPKLEIPCRVLICFFVAPSLVIMSLLSHLSTLPFGHLVNPSPSLVESNLA